MQNKNFLVVVFCVSIVFFTLGEFFLKVLFNNSFLQYLNYIFISPMLYSIINLMNLLNLELCMRRLLINTMAGVLSFYFFMTSDDNNISLKLIILIISSILFFLLIRKFRYNSNK